MEYAQKVISELGDDDLEDVAGGWFWDDVKDSCKKVKNWFCEVKEAVNKLKNFKGIGK